jgi:integrase
VLHKTISALQPPRQAAADGSYASRDNLRQAKARGVRDMAFHKKGGLRIADMVRSRWVYRKLRNFRAGIEADISCLKRAYKGRRDRHAMLSPQLLELLRGWWREGRRRGVMLPQGWLFPGRDPVNPLTTRQLRRAVHAAAAAAGINKRVTPHTLRHSFATHLLEQDIDIRVIQVLLGHAKLDTTALYARVATTTIRAVMSPLDRLGPLAGGRPQAEA